MWTNGTGKKSFLNGRRNFAYLKETVRFYLSSAIRLTELAVEARFDIRSSLTKRNHLRSQQKI